MNKNVLIYLFGAATACAWSIPAASGHSLPYHPLIMIPLVGLSVGSLAFLVVNTVDTIMRDNKKQ